MIPNEKPSEWFCRLVWAVLAVIGVLVAAAKLSLLPLPIYYSMLLPLFYIYWGVVCLNLLVLIVFLKRLAKAKSEEIHLLRNNNVIPEAIKLFLRFYSSAPIGILLTLFFFLSQILIIAESFLLMKDVVFMWILVVLLSFIAILTRITPESKVIQKQLGFVKVLNTCIILFTIFALATPFHSAFLVSTGWSDSTIFSNLVARRGDNYNNLLDQEINNLKQAPVSSYLDTWKIYIHRLSKDNLDQNVLPYKPVKDGSSIHAAFVNQALDILGTGSHKKREKQKVMETFLLYLNTVIQKDQYKELKQDKNYRLGRRFLERLVDEIEKGKFSKLPSIRLQLKKLYCALKLKTTINPNALTRIISKEEVEPCQEQ